MIAITAGPELQIPELPGPVAEMELGIVSHIKGDGDLLESWFKYYRRLGVSSFHLIVHGSQEENRRLYALKDSYPVIIEDTYKGPFDCDEKKRRLNALLAGMRRAVALACG